MTQYVLLVPSDGTSLWIISVSLVGILLQDAIIALIRILVLPATLLIIGNSQLMRKEFVFVNPNITKMLISVFFVLINSTFANCAQTKINVLSAIKTDTSTPFLETTNVSASMDGILTLRNSVKIVTKTSLDA